MDSQNTSFTLKSSIYTFATVQHLPISIEEAWDFFSSPLNLQEISPDDMDFTVTSPKVEKMYAGQILTYKVEILKSVRTNWCTEITHVQENLRFVDEQRFGPYAMWHHEHRFKKVKNGVEMRDIVSYKLPLGRLGRIVAGKFIRKKVRNIFDYRYKKLNDIFYED